MGSLVKAMRKIICLFLSCFASLYGLDHEDRLLLSIEELKENVFSTLPSVFGWCTQEKAQNFIDLVLEVKPQVYVEIGVFGGSSLFPVASALQFLGDGIIIGIDPWDKNETLQYFDPIQDAVDYQWWKNLNFERVYYSYLNLLKRFELEEYCITMKMTAAKAVTKIHSPIDILYIDGNHSQECSLQDVELYLPKVRRGGYIWMNDTLWAARQDAVELLMRHCEIVKIIDSGNCVLFKKR